MNHTLLNPPKPSRTSEASTLSPALREFVAAMPIVMLFTAVAGALKSSPTPARATTSHQFSTR